jgi:hypothetical protein
VTAHAGLPLVIEAFRALGLPEAIERHMALKRRRRGYSEASCIETLVALLASGGECVDDVRVLKADGGLKRLWRRGALPSAETLRAFLNRFHDEEAVAARVEHTAFVPAESAGLAGLRAVEAHLIAELQKRSPERCATLDVDATIIASDKREALPVYEGGTGYQPLGVWWVEQGVWVRSQFRDGNVPAQSGVLEILKESVALLGKQGVSEFAVRSDSAGYQHTVLNWLRTEKIPFAISADMSPELRVEIVAVREEDWKPLPRRRGEGMRETREWADVEFVPTHGSFKRDLEPDRYVVERVRPSQLPLFADGEKYHYFATVTNRWDVDGGELLLWSHARCGSVEPAQDVLKNELGGGVLPAKRFGANAAWWQLVVLTANLLAALKRLALPSEWRPLRPRRLRFLLFHRAGRLVQHGRQLFLRLARDHPGTEAFLRARFALAG